MVKKQNTSDETQPNNTSSVPHEAATEGFFVRLVDQFTVAWLFLTRIPLPSWWNKAKVPPVFNPDGTVNEGMENEGIETDNSKETDKSLGMTPLANTVRAWPVVGLAIGALSGGMLWGVANLGLHPLAASFVALSVAALATGALHEDGLADVADGFGGGDTKAKKLRIMRDSRIGAFGVITLVMMTGFKASALAGFNAPGFAATALLCAHVLSRSFLPMLMVAMPSARKSGLGQGAGVPSTENAVMAAMIGILMAVLTLGLGPGLVASAMAGLSVSAIGWLANRQIQGFTGDVLGAAQQLAEALIIAGLAVALRTVFY